MENKDIKDFMRFFIGITLEIMTIILSITFVIVCCFVAVDCIIEAYNYFITPHKI